MRTTGAWVVPDAAALQARQVADQLAVAFSHVHLLKALEELHWGTLTALARAIDAKSAWTAGHSERVTELAVRMGRQMGLSAEELRVMQMGGLLHDTGKIGTPPHIL
jgi:HD-GYP domain-containing protein (c-di-GMP phosphodiesterase class II)